MIRPETSVGEYSSLASWETFVTVDPSADTTKMSDCSSTPAVVASRDPSGDQSGQKKVSVNVDSRRASDPSGSTTCNVNVAELWKAMTPPFGAQAGSMPSSDGSVIWIAPDRPSRATMMLVPAPTSAAKAMRVLSGRPRQIARLVQRLLADLERDPFREDLAILRRPDRQR